MKAGMKMGKVITVGESMALFVAEQEGSLASANKFQRFVAGAELNFSIGMARLGHEMTYITKLGMDPFGKSIGDFIEGQGIDSSYITYDSQYVTGMQWKQKVSAGDPEVFSARKNSAASHMSIETISMIDWQDVEHLHLTGIAPALSNSCRDMVYMLIKEAKQHNVQISFDPNLRFGLWPDQKVMIHTINDLASHADIILPGVEEGRLLTEKQDVLQMAEFYHDMGVQTVVMKLGAKGAFTSSPYEQFYTDAYPVTRIVDTVGAGDGFAVGVVSGLLEGLPLKEAVKRGTIIGALAVMSPGDNDGLPERHTLEKMTV